MLYRIGRAATSKSKGVVGVDSAATRQQGELARTANALVIAFGATSLAMAAQIVLAGWLVLHAAPSAGLTNMSTYYVFTLVLEGLVGGALGYYLAIRHGGTARIPVSIVVFCATCLGLAVLTLALYLVLLYAAPLAGLAKQSLYFAILLAVEAPLAITLTHDFAVIRKMGA